MRLDDCCEHCFAAELIHHIEKDMPKQRKSKSTLSRNGSFTLATGGGAGARAEAQENEELPMEEEPVDDEEEPMDESNTNNANPATGESPYPEHLFRHFIKSEGGVPDAFKHNCDLRIKQYVPKFSGCHDLDCFLHAVASGVVVASIDKLPSDGLPHGVYQFQMSCRKELPTPNQTFCPPSPRCKRHDLACERCQDYRHEKLIKNDEPCTGMVRFEYFPYTKTNQSQRMLRYVECPTEQGLGELKFKHKPQIKTVYNPAIWTKERLAEKCNEAFENALRGNKSGKVYEKKTRWSGPFNDEYDEKTYWIEGFYKSINDEKKISTFNFVHPDTLKKNREHKDTTF
ncbi:uncharacterized protein LOC118408920 [Branchiostoma floridae]|uniref:Uncharacterized protein LOC118408920 n=1 Tax=Branchiostoma floridae TaxID=7739 RepID=A0A9J7HWN2_BRAFL|nr:uncharacterized protein LOC118408920 [Branchiostoma floridae]